MTATSAPVTPKTQRPRPHRPVSRRAGLWTFLRLLGGWLCVAALAYLFLTPNKDWGWPTLLFGWVLLTLLADEFGGWFGYIALALGVLPLLAATPPEQWFIIFPLVAAALFAALLVKHSGGPFVVPFAALLFAGTILAGEKLGIKMKVPLPLLGSTTFHRMTLMPMAGVMAFSFLRQLISMLVRWQQARRARKATMTPTPPISATSPLAAPSVPAARPEDLSEAEVLASAVPQVTVEPDPAAVPIPATQSPAIQPPVTQSLKNPTIIDLDLTSPGDSVQPAAPSPGQPPKA